MSKSRDVANAIQNPIFDTDVVEWKTNESGYKYQHFKMDSGYGMRFDSNGEKSISINDNEGNFHIITGVDESSDTVNTNDGAAKLGFNSDGSDGVIYGVVARQNTSGQVNWTNGYHLTEAGMWVGDPGSDTSGQFTTLPTNGETQLFNQDGPFGKAICKAWASFNQQGTQAFHRSYNCSSISDQGAGYSRIAMTRTSSISNSAAIGFSENPNGDGGNAGGPDASWNSPYPISSGSIQFDARNFSNTSLDKRYVSFVLYS